MKLPSLFSLVPPWPPGFVPQPWAPKTLGVHPRSVANLRKGQIATNALVKAKAVR